MKGIFLLLNLLLLGYGNIVAQPAAISGFIREEGTEASIPFATVQFDKLGTTTDENGHFRMAFLPPGEINLKIRSVGYMEITRNYILDPGESIQINIFLSKMNIELSEIVVTATMRETYVKDSPVKIDVVNVKRLENSRTSSNFMDLIGCVNGLSTQLNCGVCGTNAIRINGVEGPNTAVLIDGMPVMGSLASVYGLNGISPSIIDQVEVIKGPQSTLYGTQALGGVVNILTKDPRNTPSFMVNMYTESTTRESSFNMAASPKLGRFNGFVSGMLTRNQHFFDKNSDGFNDKPKQMRYALFSKGVLEGKDGEKRLNIAGKYLNEKRTGGVREFTNDLRGSDKVYGESIFTERAELLSEYRPAGLQERLRIKSALTYHDQDSYYGDSKYAATQKIIFAEATWDQPLTQNLALLSGTTFRYEYYNDNTPATAYEANQRIIPGIFTQGELSLNDLTILGGLRLDHHSDHGLVTSPCLAAKYSHSELTTIRASSGTGFRVINVFTEDHAALTGSREVFFTEDLDPERSRSITASVDQIIPFIHDLIKVSLDGFYTRFTNKIIPDYDQDPNQIVYENLKGHSVTQGFSVTIDQDFLALPLSYNAGFTRMDVYTKENGIRQAVTYAPDFLGNIGVDYGIPAINTSVSYSANLVGSKRMPDNYVVEFGRPRQTPVYGTHDLKITTQFSDVNDPRGLGFEVYVSVENIFDFTQGSPLVVPDDPFSPEFDTIYTWGPVVGRTLKFGARLTVR